MYEWGGMGWGGGGGVGVVSMFNEPLILFLCGVVRERLLPCRVVVGWMDCIVYTDYVYPVFVSLLAGISLSF